MIIEGMQLGFIEKPEGLTKVLEAEGFKLKRLTEVEDTVDSMTGKKASYESRKYISKGVEVHYHSVLGMEAILGVNPNIVARCELFSHNSISALKKYDGILKTLKDKYQVIVFDSSDTGNKQMKY